VLRPSGVHASVARSISSLPLRFLLALISLALAACSGSGSSGFDVSSENTAIDQALSQQQCVDFEGLTICPANSGPIVPSNPPTPTPTSTNTPTTTKTVNPFATATATRPPAATPSINATATRQPTATVPTVTLTPTSAAPPMQVDTAIDGSAPVACAAINGLTRCTFTLVFSAQGFHADAEFRVAVRTVNPLGSWMVNATPLLSLGPAASTFRVPVSVAVATSTTEVQLAVLVFAEPPAAVPSTVKALGDSGANFAYVTPPLRLRQ
jgi:hypothetical protein